MRSGYKLDSLYFTYLPTLNMFIHSFMHLLTILLPSIHPPVSSRQFVLLTSESVTSSLGECSGYPCDVLWRHLETLRHVIAPCTRLNEVTAVQRTTSCCSPTPRRPPRCIVGGRVRQDRSIDHGFVVSVFDEAWSRSQGWRSPYRSTPNNTCRCRRWSSRDDSSMTHPPLVEDCQVLTNWYRYIEWRIPRTDRIITWPQVP